MLSARIIICMICSQFTIIQKVFIKKLMQVWWFIIELKYYTWRTCVYNAIGINIWPSEEEVPGWL